MTYPYSERDLFQQPETYFYANCSACDFIDDWRTSRFAARSRFLKICGDNPIAIVTTPLPSFDDSTDRPDLTTTWSGSLNNFLLNVLNTLAENAADEILIMAAINPLAKKYEVFKRLFSDYGEDGRRLPDSVPADLEAYSLLAVCLAELSQRTGSLRLLSTLLKLNDALSSINSKGFDPFAAALAARSLAIEADLVSEWHLSISES